MRNQETDNQQKEAQPASGQATVTEVAKLDIQGHLLIIDNDTNEILVNQRG